ncbi:MAG: glutamine--tRNA ligase/YqeY domain fusion protein [Chloroflexota bacterium]|nr:glutamine--tRNA ligase/YqeY domain fusion protein [Chloroflexota bacterium]
MSEKPSNFITDIIDDHFENGRFDHVHTRFPPEPNGYLHIGHAKSICLNFGVAQAYGGKSNLRFDDTNPTKEEVEYVESIQRDIHWLGFDWEDRLYFASDYFEAFYEAALQLIKKGKAYVCDLSAEELREYRGTLTAPGKNSPYRDRPIEENFDLFTRMKGGEFTDGSRTLRAKIDMSSPNFNMRDPVLFRILHAEHHRTGDTWCIYPMYDYAHCISDSLEHITHSICTLEFEDHRPLYDWILEQLEVFHPQQIEFARLNLTYTVMSKRKLLQLVNEGFVSGWDDPRMPTLSGMRRRGYTPEAIRNFVDIVGVSKANSIVDMELLEHVLRDDLNNRARRVMAVLEPLKVIIDNYPDEQEETFEVPYFPWDRENSPTREVPFCREVYIERLDFMEDPPKKFYRLAPGREVRLMNAYYITCTDVIKNDQGEVVELHATYDPESRGGMSPDGRKVRGTLHWVSARHALDAELRLFGYLFNKADPYEVPEGGEFTDNINPDSLQVLKGAKLEPSLRDVEGCEPFQFMRQGYFCADAVDSRPKALVFNRTISLVDTWAKMQKQRK